MEGKLLPKSGSDKQLRGRFKITKTWLIVLLGVVAIFFWVMTSRRTTVQERSYADNSASDVNSRQHLTKPKRAAVSESEPTAASTNKYPTLTPQPMRLEKKVLASSKWNSGPKAFGLDKPYRGEGAVLGPSSVAYVNGNLYVLDSVNKRILGFDQTGRQISSVALPTVTASDLCFDSSSSSLLVIDHLNDKIYKVEGNEAVLLATLSIKNDFPMGTKFAYDAASNQLYPQEAHLTGLAEIDGNNLVLGLKKGGNLAIAFDKPVACVEEVMTDANGIIWVLYTLEGDYRMRRVLRVDQARGTAGMAEVDVWFAFDATRHMVATKNGVVLFGGDEQEGRLVSFDYGGNDF